MRCNRYYIYVITSLKDGNIYIGFSRDVNKRIKAHNSGKVRSTKSRRPFKLVYLEEVANEKIALVRERFLKSGCGREFIKSIINKHAPVAQLDRATVS